MPKSLLWSVGIALACLITFGGTLAVADKGTNTNILVIKNPDIASPSMPRVIFNHDKHETYVDERHGDCSNCHRMTKEGLSTALQDVGMQKEKNKVSYMHDTCTGCHKKSGQGPLLVHCRSCHAQ